MNTTGQTDGIQSTLEHLRKRFPCEKEIDRILSRKMLLREGPGYHGVTLDTLVTGLHVLLDRELGSGFAVRNPRWLTGGSSKLQMAFELEWDPDATGQTTTSMVLRMEPAEAIVETSRLREIQLIRAVAGEVPAPPAYWVDAEPEFFPYPAIVYGFIDGVAKPSKGEGSVAGIGTFFDKPTRERLSPQFIKYLARIHLLDWKEKDLSAFDTPALGTHAAELQLNWWERVWEEDFGEDEPIIRLAAAWLRAKTPSSDRINIVHGDYRPGNFLYSEDDFKITGILDWELGHLGDRHEDLAWPMARYYGRPDENTGEFLIGGLIPESEYFELYEAASGLSVDPKKVHYYRVLNMYKLGVIVKATGYRVALGAKTHQDILVAWLIGLNGVIGAELISLLDSEI